MEGHEPEHRGQKRREAGDRRQAAGQALTRVKLDEWCALCPVDEARRRGRRRSQGRRRDLEVLAKIDLRRELADGALALQDPLYRVFAFRQPCRQRLAAGRRRDRAEPLRDRARSEEIQILRRGLSGRGIGKGPEREKVELAFEPGERLFVDRAPRGEGALAPDHTLVPGDQSAECDRPGSAGDPGCQASGSQAREAEAAADEKGHEGHEPGPGEAQREGRRPPLRGRGGGGALAIGRPGACVRRSHGRTIARYFLRPAAAR